jgi:putative ABC transport system permease protein
MTARVRAADALGSGKALLGPGIIARVLVGVQFFSVSFLVIVLTVVRLQIDHLREVAIDPAKDPIVALDDLGLSGVSLEALAAELRSAPQVRSVTSADAPPLNNGLIWYVGTSGEPAQPGWTVERRYVGPNYFETLGVRLLAGRGFDPALDRSGLPQFDITHPLPSTPAPIVIDARLAATLGLGAPEEALGRTVYTRRASDPTQPGSPLGVVVGVSEPDRASNPSMGGIGEAGVFYAFDPKAEQARAPLIRIDRRDVSGALVAIAHAWDKVAPDIPLRLRFLDDLVRGATTGLRTTGAVLAALSLAAVAISTTGLLGIAVYVAARRRREMGIRKALGASVLRLGRMLLVDFSKPILFANLLAWPVGYLAGQLILRPFPDRVALTPLTFLVSTALTLAVAWAAVIGEVWKTASVRPAEVLRHA